MKAYFISLVVIFMVSAQTNQDSLEVVLKSGNATIKTKFELAKIYHDRVVAEEEDYTDKAEELFKSILKEKRDHSEARVYYGSLLTLKGRDAFLPWKKMSYVEEGCDEMDKAVKISPDNVQIRLMRAMNNINLPGFFNRITYCLEDFKFVRNHPAFESFKPSLKQQVFYFSAKALMDNDETIKGVELYEKVVAIDANSKLGKKASEIISE